jgi:hypothetical protein
MCENLILEHDNQTLGEMCKADIMMFNFVFYNNFVGFLRYKNVSTYIIAFYLLQAQLNYSCH